MNYRVSTTQNDYILIDGKQIFITNVELFDDCYNEGNIFGNCISKDLSFELYNDNTVDFENKNFKYFTGVWNGTVYEYIDMGTFITFGVGEKQANGFTTITAFDIMVKFNKTYEDRVTYPCTFGELLDDVSLQCGVELDPIVLINNQFIIENNQFVNNESCKIVLMNIASINGLFGIIDSDKLKLKLTSDTDIELIASEYEEIEFKRPTYGINRLVLGMKNVEGENVAVDDSVDILVNGVHNLIINDNYFAYTQQKREQLTNNLFLQVKGFGYIPYDMKGQGIPTLKLGDKIKIDGKDTIVLRKLWKSPLGLDSEMYAPAVINAVVDLIYKPDLELKLRQAEIKVDKALGTISLVVLEQSSQSSKITTVEQNVNGITSTVSTIKNIANANTSEISSVKIRTNTLEENVVGLTNTMKETGGLNILHDAPGYFKNDYWGGTVTTLINTEILDNTRSDIAFYVQNNTISQSVSVLNGTYTLSGLYKKLLALSNIKVTVNDTDIPLTLNQWNQFIYTFEVTTRNIIVKVTGDTVNAGYVADLMLNSGDLPQVFSLNQNETYTDAVKIGKGLTIESTNTNTKLEAGATGIVIRNKVTGIVKTEFTEDGIDTNYLKAKSSLIGGLLTQNINGQVCLNNIGGV